MSLTPEEIATYRTDLLEFSKFMFRNRRGMGFLPAEHHKTVCDALERVIAGRTTRLIINIPPRSGKTEIAVKNFIAFCMGNWPDCEFIHASYAKELATANVAETRNIMQHESYAAVFGEPSFRKDSNAKDFFKTNQGGTVMAVGVGGGVTGFGAGKMREAFGGAIIVDDPLKPGEAASDAVRNSTNAWFQNTLESRKNSNETPIIVIMQCLHEDDLSGFLESGRNGEEWEVVRIPAIKDDGTSFWESNSNFSIAKLRRMEASNAYVFAGQYMQNPSPIGGGLLKDAWWKYWDILPQLKWRKIYVDTAQKIKEHNDYSVFQCWGDDGTGGKYLIDQLRGKWEAPELIEVGRGFWAKHKEADKTKMGTLRAMMVEDKVSGTGLIQTLQRERIPVIGIPRGTDKVMRAMDAAPIIQTGNVYLPRDNWVKDLLAEATQFPNGKHDDQLDPLFDAVTDNAVGFRWDMV